MKAVSPSLSQRVHRSFVILRRRSGGTPYKKTWPEQRELWDRYANMSLELKLQVEDMLTALFGALAPDVRRKFGVRDMKRLSRNDVRTRCRSIITEQAVEAATADVSEDLDSLEAYFQSLRRIVKSLHKYQRNKYPTKDAVLADPFVPLPTWFRVANFTDYTAKLVSAYREDACQSYAEDPVLVQFLTLRHQTYGINLVRFQ